MDVLVVGTGGAAGWPEPGCRCASCRRAARGTARARSTVVVDGILRLTADGVASAASAASATDATDATADRPWSTETGRHRHHVREIPGGWDVTSPDGRRLLYPAGPGAVPVPPDGARPYDVAFLDVIGNPFQLGLLRARGLVTGGTTTIAAFADHRVSSIQELERRCAIWRVGVVADGARVTTVRYEEEKVFRVLVLGGARSGKSEWAEMRVATEPEVTYVATGPAADGDADWAARIAAHRARRPAWWRTAETTDLPGVLASATGAVLIDGIGTWLAAVLDEAGWDTAGLGARIAELAAAWRQTGAYIVAVSDETGLGVIPETPAGRVFRDWLGRVNQALAAECEQTELVVAGRVLAFSG